MKRYLSVFLCLVLLAVLLTGCGGGAKENAADSYAPAETMAATEEAGISSSTSLSDYADPGAKLIRDVSLDTQTRDYDTLMLAVEEKVSALGGYIENREAYNGSEFYGSGTRYCHMVIRIPADRLDEFVTYVGEKSNVVNMNESVENVTLQYTDTAARVEALETEQTRLLELLAKAENLTEILEIEARLSDVSYELSSYASQLRVLDNQVSYATVRLYIDEVEKLTPVEEPIVWDRITEGFSQSLEEIGEFATNLFVWIVVSSPWLCIWAIVITVIVLTGRKFGKGKKTKKVPPADQEQGN